MLTLKLFGTASLDGPDGPVTGRAAQGRRLALLALLALARGRPILRDKLIALLWPESPTERARAQLSDAVYIVRSALGDDVVRSVGDELALDPDAIASDVATFERLLDEGRLDAAVDLFAGPLLDGFHLSDASEFERWLDAERDRFGRRYAAALESLAERCEAGDRLAASAGWWRRLAAHDPYNGHVALRLMRALEAAGDRAGALQHARVHALLLREEFEAEPDPDVTAFAERLRLEPTRRASAEPSAVRATRSRADEAAAPSDATGEPVAATGLADAASAPRAREHAAARRLTSVRAAAAVVLLLALASVGLYGIRRAVQVGAPPVARSVAVLPFLNLSADPQNTYFSDGLSEEIIAALSRIDGLRVVARTSSFALRERQLSVRAIGDTLGVEAVLEGSVRRDGQRLRVTAQLIDAATGYHIWSDDYDRQPQDIFAVQEEIARAIAGALELQLAARAAPARAGRTPGLEAYDLYLRGLYLRNNLTADALRQATVYFDRALELEPDFGLAYAAKASVVAPLIYFGHVPVKEGVPELRVLVDRALELDPALGEAYAALGILRLFFEWDWKGAEQALRRAVELNPNDPHAYHHLGNYHSAMGRLAEAVAAGERSVELDPLNARTRIVLGAEYFVAGNYDAALAQYRRAFQLDPVNPLLLGLSPLPPRGPAQVYLLQGRYHEAVDEYVRTATLRGASAGELNELRDSFATSGMPGFWRSWLDMDVHQSGGATNSMRMAALWALIGDSAQTFHWLDRAYAERNPGLIFLSREYAFATLRSHPRFTRILREMKLPPP